MPRPPDRRLLNYLAAYEPHVSDLTLALRDIVLEEAPDSIESIVKTYAVSIGFSFTGKPLKDGFCHIVTYRGHVNLGFNRGAQMPDPKKILLGKGKTIRHITFRDRSELAPPVPSQISSGGDRAGRWAAEKLNCVVRPDMSIASKAD